MVKNIPAGNLHLSAARTPVHHLQRCSVSLLHCDWSPSAAAHFTGTSSSCCSQTILSVSKDHQQQLLDNSAQRPGDIVLGGDLRADSPGRTP